MSHAFLSFAVFFHHGFCYSDKQEDKVSVPRREKVFIVLFSANSRKRNSNNSKRAKLRHRVQSRKLNSHCCPHAAALNAVDRCLMASVAVLVPV